MWPYDPGAWPSTRVPHSGFGQAKDPMPTMTATLAALRARVASTLTVAVLALLAGCDLMGPVAAGHLDIEPADLQARLAMRFPLHRCKTALACVDLSNPAVLLQEGDDRVAFTADVKLTLGLRERSGRLGLTGRPRYAAQTGQLFLDDVQVSTLDLSGVPDGGLELLKDYGGLLARQSLQDHPVYTLDSRTAKGALSRQLVRDVKVVHGRLRVVFATAGG